MQVKDKVFDAVTRRTGDLVEARLASVRGCFGLWFVLTRRAERSAASGGGQPRLGGRLGPAPPPLGSPLLPTPEQSLRSHRTAQSSATNEQPLGGINTAPMCSGVHQKPRSCWLILLDAPQPRGAVSPSATVGERAPCPGRHSRARGALVFGRHSGGGGC